MTVVNAHSIHLAAILVLHSMPFKVYPTGSRYLGGATEHSDWDFFTADSPATRKALEEAGFETRGHEYSSEYLDVNTVAVYRMCTVYPYVDVQLQRDVDSKIAAQEVILHFKQHLQESLRDRNKRSQVWDDAYKFIGPVNYAWLRKQAQGRRIGIA